ncbi:UDP-N-acetylmuramoyl-tripeptide--D-alanyl-D-alanine ligase [Aquimarina brevivitae]|uniref:UDP-N-acetylmuramoyl-tripeptide--D-alanyl-D-alanine ligase n=1 Tax=Aquimarina brevivitae TaxID=323412 RepID=A0A4Q7PJ74_9FLAO|nr:UDP-N-acetylmuramoyl-tripeptide--D-alanyl-D-alanine ligase [Aquimarina brevivitae]RZS99890.1 UDP-N-acetylmuramoyl-tripeptide--D-alanyl-D-alanine ligase [Aquimarina brevivitae]
MNSTALHQLFLKSDGVSTDTRNIKENTLFFALKGSNFNGNQFAAQALESGASYAIIDDEKYYISDKTIVVPDVLCALQDLARFHRHYLGIPILALTGSNGKTTTKELINAVLSKKYTTIATSGNLNNHIGVTLTLLRMDSSTEFGIVEMGANHQKEIAFLCDIALPDYGYITNIGKAHLEGFGGIEGVLKGKTEMYVHLKEHHKMIFLNKDDEKLTNAAGDLNSFTFSQESGKADIQVILQQVNPMVSVQYDNITIQSNLIGDYNFGNIAAAIAIGRYFEIGNETIKEAIASYIPENNRSQIIQKGEATIIMDAYNANPTSMQAAIQNFVALNFTTKSVFLGDMFELGEDAHKEHQDIVYLLEGTNIHNIILIGENFFKTHTSSKIKTYRTFEDLKSDWNTSLVVDANLIKGSRGMKLERILDLIT